jgi:hypothetical protein
MILHVAVRVLVCAWFSWLLACTSGAAVRKEMYTLYLFKCDTMVCCAGVWVHGLHI